MTLWALTCWTSIPRAQTSVVMSTLYCPDLNSFMMASLSFWGMSPCIDDTVKLASRIFSVSQSTCIWIIVIDLVNSNFVGVYMYPIPSLPLILSGIAAAFSLTNVSICCRVCNSAFLLTIFNCQFYAVLKTRKGELYARMSHTTVCNKTISTRRIVHTGEISTQVACNAAAVQRRRSCDCERRTRHTVYVFVQTIKCGYEYECVYMCVIFTPLCGLKFMCVLCMRSSVGMCVLCMRSSVGMSVLCMRSSVCLSYHYTLL